MKFSVIFFTKSTCIKIQFQFERDLMHNNQTHIKKHAIEWNWNELESWFTHIWRVLCILFFFFLVISFFSVFGSTIIRSCIFHFFVRLNFVRRQNLMILYTCYVMLCSMLYKMCIIRNDRSVKTYQWKKQNKKPSRTAMNKRHLYDFREK